jgi:hypothetical protein
VTHSQNIGDLNLTFSDGFRMTGLQGTLTLRVDQCLDTHDIDDVFAWAYKENVVSMMFRTRNNKGCAVVQLDRHHCVEMVYKLTEILREADNSHQSSQQV